MLTTKVFTLIWLKLYKCGNYFWFKFFVLKIGIVNFNKLQMNGKFWLKLQIMLFIATTKLTKEKKKKNFIYWNWMVGWSWYFVCVVQVYFLLTHKCYGIKAFLCTFFVFCFFIYCRTIWFNRVKLHTANSIDIIDFQPKKATKLICQLPVASSSFYFEHFEYKYTNLYLAISYSWVAA